jgi:hypothetical protein
VSPGTSTLPPPTLAEVAPHKDQFDSDLLDFLKAPSLSRRCEARGPTGDP